MASVTMSILRVNSKMTVERWSGGVMEYWKTRLAARTEFFSYMLGAEKGLDEFYCAVRR
jgi:hypothetical protein